MKAGTKSLSTVAELTELLGRLLRGKAEFACVLGSFGTERFGPESDIDLAVFLRPGVPEFETLRDLRAALEEASGRDVDVAGLNGVDLIYARQVVETGRLLYAEDPDAWPLWRARQMSLYPDFKFSRRIIEDNLLAKRKI